MRVRIALDSNAIIAALRGPVLIEPHPFVVDAVIPLPVVGELFAGAFMSSNRDSNLTRILDFLYGREIVAPDFSTAHQYGSLRGLHRGTPPKASKINDLWIAALCLQHNLP
ncbi:MAG: PIN domain-containing protein, partial [Thermoanaerobaculia bacterium]